MNFPNSACAELIMQPMWLQKLTIDVLLLVKNSDRRSSLPTMTVFMQTLLLYNDFTHIRYLFMLLPTIQFFFCFVLESNIGQYMLCAHVGQVRR